ncbi:MAG: FHA domain-containing protein [Anaerolineaceae bacterium]
MSKRLEKIESRIQQIIEGAGKLFSTGSPTETLSEQLIRCMRENMTTDTSGLLSAPARYLVEVNLPGFAGRVYDKTDFEQLSADLICAASESGILLHGKPEIIIRPNPDLTVGSIKISASRFEINPGNTASVNILDEPEPTNSLPLGAFLIVNGTETVQLHKLVINIGRKANNDIILDDPRVSRNHAQLRSIKDRYVVFDLNSSGGTFVNNVPVTQKELQPGDVISMAGVTVIFGQDSGGAIYEPEEQTPTNQLLSFKPGEKK